MRKYPLLLAVILAARCFGSGSSRRTLAMACDETMESTPGLKNNRYSYRSATDNNYDDYNYKWVHGDVDVDGIADSNEDDNNDNYNYNKAPAKWQPQQQQQQQQKLYGNPIHSIYDRQQHLQRQQQQHEQQQQQQLEQQQQGMGVGIGMGLGQFDDDPENARNDFRLQLSDLNAAVQGMGRFAAPQDNQDKDQDNSNSNSNSNRNSNSNSNSNGNSNIKDNSNINWLQPAEEQEQLLLARRSRSSNINQRSAMDEAGAGAAAGEPGQPEYTNNELPSGGLDDVDIEGEEDYAGQEEDADELSAQLPYGIQNVRKRRVRSVMPPVPFLGPNPSTDGVVTYQSLCPTNRVTVKLESGDYRPNHYVEVTCAHSYSPQPSRNYNYEYGYRGNELLRALLSERSEKREICSATGFSCIQLNRTIHLIRLNDASGCWESETRTVPSGCECMWPKHSYGDIAFYHQAQKRRGGVTGLRPHAPINVDYKPGVGYRQLTLRTRNPKPAPRSRREDMGYESYDFN
ncbi:myb-like protein AA isoform X2 [Drosophila teissieri]|uniref:myb-like protein AA isoform X2 n=1 Tax=Drosophila teissieri TaxID=7243 RepID=UPI001CBA5C96|nr:myb-like protein AA isoform X2 [Drosophila teissieri]